MKTERMALNDLHADPANVRLHSDRNLAAIMTSLKRFGQQKPIVVDDANIVRAGNGTLAAALKLGWTHLDVVRTALTGAEATAYAIADNRTAELAEWDVNALAPLLLDADIGDVGFEPGEIDALLHDADDEPAALAVPEAWQVVAECADESAQRELYEKLTQEGYRCRVLTL